MKYIKLFENFGVYASNYSSPLKQICWKVPTERIKWVASILKLMKGNDEEEINFWIDRDFHDEDSQGDYVFLFYSDYGDNNQYWSWCSWNEDREEEYKDIYKDEPNLTEEDLENAEMWLSSKKYNL